MKWTSVLAIYFLIFCLTAFLLLPFGVKTHEEVGAERVPGHLMKAAIVAALLTAVYVANYQFGWLTVDDLDFYN